MSTRHNIEQIHAIDLSCAQRKHLTELATGYEKKQSWSFAYTLLYLGSFVLPQAAFVPSSLQQQRTVLTVKCTTIISATVRSLPLVIMGIVNRFGGS